METQISKKLKHILKRDPSCRVRISGDTGDIRYLRGNLAKTKTKSKTGLRKAAKHFMASHPEVFSKISTGDLQLLNEQEDPAGGRSITYQQMHGDYPVFGGSVRMHFTKSGVLDTVRNHLAPDLAKVPRKPKLTAAQAVKAAQAHLKCEVDPSDKPKLLVHRDEGRPRLAWEVRFVDTRVGEHGAPCQWVSYVDATTGKVFLAYDNVQTVGAIVASGTGYYSGAGNVNAWDNGTVSQLRDTTRVAAGGPEIRTSDEDGASPSEDTDADWNASAIPPRDAHQGPEVDAHRYAGNVIDYFQTVHSRNSFDDAGANVMILSHFGNDVNNGFWDGTQVKLGDGTGVSPGDDFECSDDWLAHELTHAYTQFTCGLVYLNESGALNEAFSDVFAAFIAGNWLIFEDTWLKASAPAWRNMIDPTNGGNWNVADPITSVLAGHQPSHYADRYIGGADSGGVHINSGIINNLFYLLTVGGTHTVSGITVSGIGQSAAERMLWRCMSDNLVGNPNADFLDFREAMLDACQDLFPTDLDKLTQVKRAFNAVGIGPDLYVRDNLADAGEEPYTGGYLWASPDIINRTALAAIPAVDFADLTNDALWQNVEFGQNNYVYVRLQNRGAADGDATINVYFSAASTFASPGSWTYIGTLSETGIAPGSMRVAGPLTFPKVQIPSVGHYCMIAVINDPLDPAPDITLISSVTDFLSFVRNSNNIAYRNMNVVDFLPDTPGTINFEVGAFRRFRAPFDLHFDVGRLVPGLRLRVRAPAHALDGAKLRGFKLVARTRTQEVYELLEPRDRLAQFDFAFPRLLPLERVNMTPGFDNVLIAKKFRVQLEYLPPGKREMTTLFKRLRSGAYQVSIRQAYKGQDVGGLTFRFRAGKKQRSR